MTLCHTEPTNVSQYCIADSQWLSVPTEPTNVSQYYTAVCHTERQSILHGRQPATVSANRTHKCQSVLRGSVPHRTDRRQVILQGRQPATVSANRTHKCQSVLNGSVPHRTYCQCQQNPEMSVSITLSVPTEPRNVSQYYTVNANRTHKCQSALHGSVPHRAGRCQSLCFITPRCHFHNFRQWECLVDALTHFKGPGYASGQSNVYR